MHGHSKDELHWLYNTKSSNEPPKIFLFNDLRFWFGGTSYRTSEKMILYVEIPRKLLYEEHPQDSLPYETYILHMISPIINELSKSYQNIDKNVREKAQFGAQIAGNYYAKRSGICYIIENDAFLLRLNFNIPLVNAISVNSKATIKAVRDILVSIEKALNDCSKKKLIEYIKTYHYQKQIRAYIRENNLCAFIANGSILPRENGTTLPLKNAIPFVTPDEMKVTIRFPDGKSIIGMGIKKGVTVITGGGYSGKSTMLDAIEMGIYNHTPGDGREYVIADDSALKIYAEDGRPVSEVDLTPFFKFLPENKKISNFSTLHASGSVSQAANIIEAVYGKCKLLLIDEDKSATNFMIRDKNMRFIVKNEPIIPFTDRVRELFEEKDISTILVIGGSSEYLQHADSVILMEDYVPHMITKDIRNLNIAEVNEFNTVANWNMSRCLVTEKTDKPFVFFRSVKTENEKKIILDEYSADITLLTALVSENQLNTLSWIMEALLTDKDVGHTELLDRVKFHTTNIFMQEDTTVLVPEAAQRFYEEIRPLDAFCCLNRMRGVHFIMGSGDML